MNTANVNIEVNKMLVDAVDGFMREALAAIAGAVCTPEKGYIEDGGLQLLLSDIKRLRSHHDELKTQLAAERQARQDAELLARVCKRNDLVCGWGEDDCGGWFYLRPARLSAKPIEASVTIGHNGLPQLTDALRAELRQALEGR